MNSAVRAPKQDNTTQMVAATQQPVASIKREASDMAAHNLTGKAPTKPKSRKRVNTAEKRASHNAVERQRREMLNGRFLVSPRIRELYLVTKRTADMYQTHPGPCAPVAVLGQDPPSFQIGYRQWLH